VGWIALGASALGFILACIPPAMIFGWILLSAGFVLSIVAFFLRGAKWAAIVALALAVVGTIVGLIVFFLFVANTVQEIATGDDTSITDGATIAPDEDSEEQDTADEEAATGTDGSRDDPLPLGTVIPGTEYDVVVNSVTLHATDAVVAENMFNEPPADGFEYIVVNVTVTYTGSDSGYASMASVDYVTSTGEVITSYDSFVVGPEPTLGLDELYNGGTSTGNVVLSIPIDDAGLLRITPGILDDEVFVELQ
jgi:energy-coupling factor transporter transmembrane protein EcfT